MSRVGAKDSDDGRDERSTAPSSQSFAQSAPRQARKGWDEQFRLMAQRGEDKVIELPPSDWDEEEWEWEADG